MQPVCPAVVKKIVDRNSIVHVKDSDRKKAVSEKNKTSRDEIKASSVRNKESGQVLRGWGE